MLLFLMRHGLAERPALGAEDAARRLTDHGVSEVTQLAQALARAQPGLEYVCSSPYLRARQTAEQVAAALEIPLHLDRRLAPGCSLDSLEELHAELGHPERFMTVGHQPDVGYIVQGLTGRSVTVREGSLIIIDVSTLRGGDGVLRGVVTPEATTDLRQILGGA